MILPFRSYPEAGRLEMAPEMPILPLIALEPIALLSELGI